MQVREWLTLCNERKFLEEQAHALGIVDPQRIIMRLLRSQVLLQQANQEVLLESRNTQNLETIRQNETSSSESYLPDDFGPHSTQHRDQNENGERKNPSYIERLIKRNCGFKQLKLVYIPEIAFKALQCMSGGEYHGTGTHRRVANLEKFVQKSIDDSNERRITGFAQKEVP